jgi:RNA polymerase sigma-70 factor, ECF subfamily
LSWKKLLDQIWHQYHTSLLSFIRRRVDVDDLAEDILQDVFIKAHLQLDTLERADQVQSWIYQIARNTIIDYYRTRKSTEPLPDEVPEQLEQGDQEWQSHHNINEETRILHYQYS